MDDRLFDRYVMNEALKEAKKAYDLDEVPIGAVITYEGKIIARAHNQVETLNDPTAHAEMIAITQAANTIGHKWLYDCRMFVTIEPCSMCAGALVLSRLKSVIFGAKDPKAGGCISIYNILKNPLLNHHVDYEDGFMQDECTGLIQRFFRTKRKDARDKKKSGATGLNNT